MMKPKSDYHKRLARILGRHNTDFYLYPLDDVEGSRRSRVIRPAWWRRVIRWLAGQGRGG